LNEFDFTVKYMYGYDIIFIWTNDESGNHLDDVGDFFSEFWEDYSSNIKTMACLVWIAANLDGIWALKTIKHIDHNLS
jgi:hypothetical protein